MLPTTINKNMMLLEQKEHITKEQHYQILEACEKYWNGKLKEKQTLTREYLKDRDLFLLLTLWNTGARIGDVILFSVDNYNTYAKEMTYFVNKLSKKDDEDNVTKPVYHKIFLEDSYIIAFQNYIKKWDLSGYLFVASDKQRGPSIKQVPITTRQVNRIVHKYAKMAGLDINPHMYRHGLAVYMLNQGVPIEIISKHLGHQRIETTVSFYAKINSETVRKYVEDRMRIN